MEQVLQGGKESRGIAKMRAFARRHYQPEAHAVGATIGDAGVRAALSDLPFGQREDASLVAIDFIFPADEERFGKQLAQAGDDFRGGNEFGQQRALAGGEFPI